MRKGGYGPNLARTREVTDRVPVRGWSIRTIIRNIAWGSGILMSAPGRDLFCLLWTRQHATANQLRFNSVLPIEMRQIHPTYSNGATWAPLLDQNDPTELAHEAWQPKGYLRPLNHHQDQNGITHQERECRRRHLVQGGAFRRHTQHNV